MIYIKTEDEIAKIREGGHILAGVMDALVEMVKPGLHISELEKTADRMMIEAGGRPAFKGYKPAFGHEAFPTCLCISVNEEIVHGPANRDIVLSEGDVVGIDMGFEYKGMFTDMARTIPVGKVSKKAQRLLATTQECLARAIRAIKPGEPVSVVGDAVEPYAHEQGFAVIYDLVGHGVGKEIHEDPAIPNYKDKEATKHKFEKGMVVAIEPMLSYTNDIELADDRWTYVTADSSMAAQFENTVAINYDGSIEILTPTKWSYSEGA